MMLTQQNIQTFLKTIYDDRFVQNKFKYFAQCTLATITIFLILISLNIVPNDVVVASIGATSFMVFATPHKNISRARYIIGGYLFGVIIGIICHYIAHSNFMMNAHLLPEFNDEIFGALAVGFTMFLMVIFNSEHPPAAAVSLGLVINEWSTRTLVLTVLAISLLLSYRYLFRKFMIDLI